MSLQIVTKRLDDLKDDLNGVLQNTDNTIASLFESAIELESVAVDQEVDASDLVQDLEAALKSLIDAKNITKIELEILDNLRARAGSGESLELFLEIFRRERSEKVDAYTGASGRLESSEDLLNFHKMLWEIRNPGQPYRPGQAAGNAASADLEEDDLAVVGGTETFLCPITKRTLVDPHTSQSCRHSYSGAAILELLKSSRNGQMECPVAGCEYYVTRGSLKQDQYLTMRIKLELERRARAKEQESESDVEAID
ncbi:uncharacterized protein BJ171DRAFT_474948 [Polychytrium aggregatum]|uniref:uncharacterized protein n=1 Tax=Polychytrium aggregatum TaxID=110093 RepID=UPI0022FDE06E|nr:uncharacterized protein BJ171DRAFT_474948 [Polychytrium aggregatum]KAI9204737.1 hypothetical protein BJ171DRAFT_474948 [Polychytrium aggregatum]